MEVEGVLGKSSAIVYNSARQSTHVANSPCDGALFVRGSALICLAFNTCIHVSKVASRLQSGEAYIDP